MGDEVNMVPEASCYRFFCAAIATLAASSLPLSAAPPLLCWRYKKRRGSGWVWKRWANVEREKVREGRDGTGIQLFVAWIYDQWRKTLVRSKLARGRPRSYGPRQPNHHLPPFKVVGRRTLSIGSCCEFRCQPDQEFLSSLQPDGDSMIPAPAFLGRGDTIGNQCCNG